MYEKNHITTDEIESLLFGEQDETLSRKIERHIDHCEPCRKSLDQLAADDGIWNKLGTLLDEHQSEETIAFRTSVSDESNIPHAEDSNEVDFVYPIETLFDPPSHPEMLGRIGKYDVEKIVGRGGMGVVVKAFDAELHRPVAIKMLAPHLATIGTARKRFAREARAAAAVLHPNVIAIHGVDSESRTPFIVMPYIVGPSLQALVDRTGPLDQKDIVRIGMQIAGGLAAAHSQGIVHRDIKPANILIEQNVCRVLITDFGLARAADDASMTQTGFLAGTPNFMSPEQTCGKPIDHRSDLFSLGSVMYFMATGRLPFRAETPIAVLHRIVNDTATPVRHVNPDIGKPLAEIIDHLLAKDADKRCQSAAQLYQSLEQLLAHLHQPEFVDAPRLSTKSTKNKPGIAAAKPDKSTSIKFLVYVFAAAVVFCVAMLLYNSGLFSVEKRTIKSSSITTQPMNVEEFAGAFESIAASHGFLEDNLENEFESLAQSINAAHHADSHLFTGSSFQGSRDLESQIEELAKAIQHLDEELGPASNRDSNDTTNR